MAERISNIHVGNVCVALQQHTYCSRFLPAFLSSTELALESKKAHTFFTKQLCMYLYVFDAMIIHPSSLLTGHSKLHICTSTVEKQILL
jgi:hypothetical protein